MDIHEKFKEFNWHDCPVYSIKFDDELLLDIDYILQWQRHLDESFLYLLSPANLVFHKVSNIKISIEAQWLNGFEIDEIILNRNNYYLIQLQEGTIEFQSSGFTQNLRKTPIWKNNQYLSEEERQ